MISGVYGQASVSLSAEEEQEALEAGLRILAMKRDGKYYCAGWWRPQPRKILSRQRSHQLLLKKGHVVIWRLLPVTDDGQEEVAMIDKISPLRLLAEQIIAPMSW